MPLFPPVRPDPTVHADAGARDQHGPYAPYLWLDAMLERARSAGSGCLAPVEELGEVRSGLSDGQARQGVRRERRARGKGGDRDSDHRD